jgi:hypothetical protein
MIKPVGDSIYFTFTKKLRNGFFRGSETDWGLDLGQTVDYAVKSRWGKVIEVGPEAVDVKAGDFILIEEGKWTVSVTEGDNTFWRTREIFVELIADNIDKMDC